MSRRFFTRGLAGVLAGIILVTNAGCGSAPPDFEAAIAEVEPDLYRIGAGDVLTISVWANPDLSLSVPVRPDGFISMPLIGDIKALNLDAESLAGEITIALSNQLRNPQVTVIVTQVNSVQYSSRVRVTGAVMTPSTLPYARGMTVLDAILEAGGVNDMSSANRARLYRIVNDELINLRVRLDDILRRGELETNYQMRPGDVITVPERLF